MNKQTQQETVWCFRRWSRKPWSAFAGMCRLKIGVLSVAMSIILLATPTAGAQTVGTDTLPGYETLHLDDVYVTARRSASAAVVTHTTVSQTRVLVDQKAAAPLQTIESAMRLVPSIDIRERGGKSVQTDIAIRGGSFDQTMVMLNGIDFSDARTGHQSHSLPVDIDIVSDIAVVEGVACPGALSGAVDFQTRAAFARYLRVRLEGGMRGYGYGNLSGAWTRDDTRSGDRLTVLGAGSYRRSDGYRTNTDFWNANAYSRVLYESPRAGTFDVQGGFQRRDWGSNGFYSLRYPMQFESTTTGLASARWSKRWSGLSLAATGSFRRNDDRFEMVRGNPDPAAGGMAFNYHTTYNLAASFVASYDWRRAGRTSLGANHTHHKLFSTAMGKGLADPSHRIPDKDGDHPENYPKGSSRNITSGWVSHNVSWRRGLAQGLATLVHTPYGTDGTFGVGVGWQPDRIVSVSGSVLRSMRLPTFTDLFYNVATYHPDPNLKPETAMTYRLSATASSPDRWGAEAAVWYRRTSGVIDWEQREDGDWYSTQLNRMGTLGAELSMHWKGSADGLLRLAMLNYGYIRSDMTVATGYISKYALDYMRHKVSAVVGVGFLRDFTLTLTGSFYDRVGSFVAADGEVEGYRPYFLLDGRLSWQPRGEGRFAGLQLYVDVTNITDTRYFDFGGLPMPGAWLSGGVAITIR